MRFVWLLCFMVFACNDAASAGGAPSLAAPKAASAKPRSQGDPNADGPIRIELLRAGESPPTFVMRGGPRGPGRLVFLHGMCGHGLGYVQSFQFSAAQLGTLIAPQADVSCGDVWSKWSNDLQKLDARIVDAFRALGHQEPISDILVIGMSQGASRAIALARKWPERYSRLIAMASPTAIRPGELRGLHGAVMMAGERDRQDLMRASERALKQSGIPATFMLIPQATHGAMGPTPEKTMAAAFSFLRELPPASATKP